MSKSYSPLRYPGGKSRLTNFIKLTLKQNNIANGIYVEPFAGGAGVAIGLLLDDAVDRVMINDIDPTIYAFWYSVLNNSTALCKKIKQTPVNMDEWYHQKQIFSLRDTSNLLELGFATFFLNRTNRSGILNAGVIGGKYQTGEWKIDARFNKEKLIQKIKNVSKFRKKITLKNMDARKFIQKYVSELSENSLVYLDPPYFHKGQKLYLNAFSSDDHILVAHCVQQNIHTPWMVSYDNTPEISKLYSSYRQEVYSLNYTAADRYHGSEIIIYSNGLSIPNIPNPFTIDQKSYNKFMALQEIG